MCDRPLDEVVFAGSHNSMSSDERGWLAPNHRYAVPTQLEDGVRLLNFDVYEQDGEAVLCHGYCSLGQLDLVDGLAEVSLFLEENSSEVVIITFEMYASPHLVESAFEDSGLLERVHVLESGAMPTLGALVAADERVLVFTSDGGGEPAWYHDMWQWWWDNPYAAERIEDFSCEPYRGHEGNPFMAINHFLTAPIGTEALAEQANVRSVLEEHVRACMSAAGRKPNQVLVDFYSVGGLLSVVSALNQ